MAQPPTYELTPADSPLQRWGSGLIVAVFVVALVLLGIMTSLAYEYLFVLPAILLTGWFLVVVSRSPLALLCTVVACFAAVSRYEEGFQVTEVAYGLFFMGYLGYWYISRLFFYRDRIARTSVDWALLVFLVYATFSFGVTLLFQGVFQVMLSEWLAMIMLAFYFPVKEVFQRDELAPKAMAFVVGGVAIFMSLRNFHTYWVDLQQASQVWKVLTGRATTNEHFLLLCSIVALGLLVHAKKRYRQILLGLVFTLLTAGVIIGQSRAVWVSLALGGTLIFLLVDRSQKVKMVMLGGSGLLLLVTVGFLIFDDFFSLLLAGLLDRASSLETAATKDLSLINRFVEARAVFDYILANPIVGYGYGVPYRYYSLVYEATHETSFIHNGYVAAWYRHGLIGMSLLFTFFFGSIWRSYRLVRHSSDMWLAKIVGIAVTAALVAESLVANTENPFATSDKTLIIAILAGAAAGIWERYCGHPE